LESREMPHLVYTCSLSTAVSRFCICLASISRSRCSFLALREADQWTNCQQVILRGGGCVHYQQVMRRESDVYSPHSWGRVQAAYYHIARGASPGVGISEE
jgi:hypothetical protein